MSETYGDDDDVCALLRISKSRLRAKISANESLPPRIQIPESRVRLWRMSEVYNWLNKFETKDEANSGQPNFNFVRKTRLLK